MHEIHTRTVDLNKIYNSMYDYRYAGVVTGTPSEVEDTNYREMRMVM